MISSCSAGPTIPDGGKFLIKCRVESENRSKTYSDTASGGLAQVVPQKFASAFAGFLRDNDRGFCRGQTGMALR